MNSLERRTSRDICWTRMRPPMACERLVRKLRREGAIESENAVLTQELAKEVVRDE